MKEPFLHNYKVRVSDRAKRVLLKISVQNGLEIVIPKRYPKNRIPEIIERRRAWIETTLKRMDERRRKFTAQASVLPEMINLEAIREDWLVEYTFKNTKKISITEEPGCVLKLEGEIDNIPLVKKAVQKWVSRQARINLLPWLDEVSREINLPFSKATIRSQRTRWGSCSSRKTISLNRNLLFLPEELVRYILIHELAHTVELNHSARYWKLVEEKEPNFKEFDKAMRDGWKWVPAWMM
ncbi:MAG TPA: SprT family zinc-dependent metalloprotease [Patescibacteria group bacterium]|nr:SprT family zinc-dependent metalloprotease [Patescibacteria group bacterium]